MKLVTLFGAGFALTSVSLPLAGSGDRPHGTAHAIVARNHVFEADNPDHGFRVRFDERGVRLGPREGLDGLPWSLGLVWVGYGRGETMGPVPAGSLHGTPSRLDLRRGSFVEWYENGPRGLKQSFFLPEPPAGGRAYETRCVTRCHAIVTQFHAMSRGLLQPRDSGRP